MSGMRAPIIVVLVSILLGVGIFPASGTIVFIPPTPDNASVNTTGSIQINTSVSNNTANSTSLLNWNRSLVVWYTMNNATGGTNIEDLSGNGLNGTWYGNTTANTTAGKFGLSVRFDRVNDWIQIPPTALLNFTKEDSFAIELFLTKPLCVATEVIFAIKGASMTYPDIYISCTNTDKNISAHIADSNGVNYKLPGTNISDNQEHYVAVQYNGTGSYLSLSIDSILINQTTTNFTGNFTYPANVSACLGVYSCFSAWNPYLSNVSIDELRIWRRTLSSAEINSSYNATSNPLNVSFSGLSAGEYNYTAYIQDSTGAINQTETRYVTVSTNSSNVSIVQVYDNAWQPLLVNDTMTQSAFGGIIGATWLSSWNSTSQAFEVYKANWPQRATQPLSKGSGVLAKFSTNKTISLALADTYDWNINIGWNLIGIERNATLAQINASVNTDCQVDTISYTDPATGTEYSYTCGQTGNESVQARAGEAIWMNSSVEMFWVW